MESNSTIRMQLAAGRTNNSVMSQKDSIGPCCKCFFPSHEGGGDSLNDVAGNAVLTSAGNFVWDAAIGSAQLVGQTGEIALASGELPDITGKDFILLFAGVAVDDAFPSLHFFSVGDTTANAGLEITSGPSGTVQEHVGKFHGSDTVATPIETPNAVKAGDSVVQALIGDRNGNLTLRVTGDKTFTETVDMQGATGAKLASFITMYGLKSQGIAILAFKSGLPDDYDTGIDWMGDDWRSKKDGTKRLIFPEWVTLE